MFSKTKVLNANNPNSGQRQSNRKPVFVSNKQDQTVFPEDLSLLQYKGHLEGGSGGVDVLEDAHGKRFTFKANHDIDLLVEEIVADGLYQALGCPVPDSATYFGEIPACLREQKDIPGNGIFRLAAFIQSSQEHNNSLIQEKIAQHFLIDAFLANRDVATRDENQQFKNVILDNNNVLYRIDNGGALRRKSVQGLKAQDPHWSAHFVEELQSFRDPEVNQDASSVYGIVTEETLYQQFQQLLSQKQTLFNALDQMALVLPIERLDDLQDFIAARLDDLKIQFGSEPFLETKAFASIRADPKHNSASIFMVSSVNAVRSVLLGQRISHDWCSDFGGMSEPVDATLAMTASREAYEETGGRISVPVAYLSQCPSHDLITEKARGGAHTHRMYIAEQDYVPEKEVTLAIQDATAFTKEYIQVEWVPLGALVDAIRNNTCSVEEGIETICLKYRSPETNEEKEMILYPPLAKMLQQKPVLDSLQKMLKNLPVFCKRTRSYPEENRSHCRTLQAESKGNFESVGTKIQALQAPIAERHRDPAAIRSALVHKTIFAARVNLEIKARKKRGSPAFVKTQSIRFLYSLLSDEAKSDTEVIPLKKLVADFFKMQVPVTVEKLVQNFKITEATAAVMQAMAADTAFQNTLVRVVEAESEYPNRVVLYHATNSKMGFLSDFFSTLRGLLAVKELRSLRAVDNIFEGIANVEAFLAEQCQKQGVDKTNLDNFVSDYQKKCLSCNAHLFANYDCPTSFSPYYWYTDGSASNNEMQYLENGIQELFDQLEIRTLRAQNVVALYQKYKDKKQLGAHLYQIFLEDEVVDNLCYPSAHLGHYYTLSPSQDGEMKTEVEHRLSHILKNLDKNPQPGLQIRLFLRPDEVHGKSVTIKTYKTQETPADLQEEMLRLVQYIVQELLQKRLCLESYYQGSIQGEARLMPLQRLYAYASLGENQLPIRYDGVFFIEALYRHIETGNVAAFERVLKALPPELPLDRDIIDLSGSKKIPLFHYAMMHQQTKMVEGLLNSNRCSPKVLMQTDSDRNSAFLYAVENGHREAVDLILASKHCTQELFRQTDWGGDFSLTCAAAKGHIEIMDSLLKSGHCTREIFSQVTKFKKNVFTEAAYADHSHVMDLLLKSRHCSPEALLQMDINNHSALLWAAFRGHTKMVSLIVASEHCSPEVFTQVTGLGETTLYLAVINDNLAMIKAILQSRHCTEEFIMHPAGGGVCTALTWASIKPEIITILESKIAALRAAKEKESESSLNFGTTYR